MSPVDVQEGSDTEKAQFRTSRTRGSRHFESEGPMRHCFYYITWLVFRNLLHVDPTSGSGEFDTPCRKKEP